MSGGKQGDHKLLSSLAKRKLFTNAPDEESSSPITNATDEESSSPDRFLIGQTPRGALRSKHLLHTAPSFDKILNENPDRAKYWKEIERLPFQ
jgi:hypothetical protein